jgi:predicted DNA-binding helix-hairpin-helix protein
MRATFGKDSTKRLVMIRAMSTAKTRDVTVFAVVLKQSTPRISTEHMEARNLRDLKDCTEK